MADINNFGRNLFIMLHDKKMTTIDLANRVGITRQAISAYTSGKRKPSSDVLIAISNALGVTVDELVR